MAGHRWVKLPVGDPGSALKQKTRRFWLVNPPGSSSRDRPGILETHTYMYVYIYIYIFFLKYIHIFVSFFEANVVGDLHFSKKSRLEDAEWIFFLHVFFLFRLGKGP